MKTNDFIPQEIKDKLRSSKLKKLNSIVNSLYTNNKVIGILLGGSVSYSSNLTKSDIDLFCLIQDTKEFINDLYALKSENKNIDEIIYQGNFAWTNELYSLYYKSDIDFSIDLCLVDFKQLGCFFWEPKGIILFDKQMDIEKARHLQMNQFDYTMQPFLRSNPFSLAVINLKKIEKNLQKNRLWNAIECLNIFRRYIMQILRINILKNINFLGRVDREIEEVISVEINYNLASTLALYNQRQIASCATSLIDLLTSQLDYFDIDKEKINKKWIIRQLHHERLKLNNYCKDA